MAPGCVVSSTTAPAIGHSTPASPSRRRTMTSATPPSSRGPSPRANNPLIGAPTDPSPSDAVEPPAASRRAWGPVDSGLQPLLVINRSRPQTTSIASGWPQAARLSAPAAGAPASAITWIIGPSRRWKPA